MHARQHPAKPDFAPAQPAAVVVDFDEIVIDAQRLNGTFVFYGTREQLVTEGVVESGLVFPGLLRVKRWKDSRGFEWVLRRERPPGITSGPREQWMYTCDWWRIRCNAPLTLYRELSDRRVAERSPETARQLVCRERRLESESTPALERYWKAHLDDGFQAFLKGILPMSREVKRIWL